MASRMDAISIEHIGAEYNIQEGQSRADLRMARPFIYQNGIGIRSSMTVTVDGQSVCSSVCAFDKSWSKRWVSIRAFSVRQVLGLLGVRVTSTANQISAMRMEDSGISFCTLAFITISTNLCYNVSDRCQLML